MKTPRRESGKLPGTAVRNLHPHDQNAGTAPLLSAVLIPWRAPDSGWRSSVLPSSEDKPPSLLPPIRLLSGPLCLREGGGGGLEGGGVKFEYNDIK